MTFCSTDCQRQHWSTGEGRELCRQLSLKGQSDFYSLAYNGSNSHIVAEKEGLATFAVPLSTAERAFLLFVMQRQFENNVSALRQHYLQSDPHSEESVYIDLSASDEARIAFRTLEYKVDAVRKDERLVWMAIPWRVQAHQYPYKRIIVTGCAQITVLR